MFCVAPGYLTLRAAFEDKIPAARPAAMGGGFVSVPNDANGIFYNPASLGGLSSANISLTQTSLFNLPDAPYMTFAAAFPTKNLGSMGFAYTQFGGSLYKETELTLSHSFPLARGVYCGYNIRNQAVDMKTFGGAAGMGLDAGFYAAMPNNISAGFSASNITGPMLGSTDEALPQVYRMGVSYYPAAGVILLLETSKDLLANDLSYHGGAEINVSKNFAFRAGTKTNPSGFATGFGFAAGIFRINYAMLTNPILDAQHFFTLGLKFGPEEDIAPVDTPARRGAKSSRRAPSQRSSTSRIVQYEEAKNLKINPNTASADELKEIPGVGALTAQRIIDHRGQGAAFSSADDLMGVPRMTKRILERMRPYLIFDGSPQAPSRPAAPTPPTMTPSRPAPPVSAADDDEQQPEPDPEETPAPPAKQEPVKPAASPAKARPVETPKVTAPSILPAGPAIPFVPPAIKPVVPSETPKPPVLPKVVEPVKPAVPPAPEKSAAPVSDDMLDINTAGAQELQVIGFTQAQAKNIIRYRAKEGNFSSVDDILKVPGVDAKTLGNVRESITAR